MTDPAALWNGSALGARETSSVSRSGPSQAIQLDLFATSIELTQQICDIESVSGNEELLADSIESSLAGLFHLEVIRDGNIVVARTNLGREHRVVIAGHIDTVPLNDNLPTRFEMVEGEPYLWGRGTVDMKSGVAVQLKLAAELTQPAVDVTWMWYDNEETSSELNGLRQLSERRPDLFRADFAILGEPSSGRVEVGCNGSMRAEVGTTGLRAHAARSWMGKNAIHEAGKVLQFLAQYEASEVEVEGLVYREGLNAVGIGGGIAGNVIPDECLVEISYRFAPNKTAAEAIDYVRGLFPEYPVRVLDISEGARPGLGAQIVQDFVIAVDSEVAPKYGWTDVARFSALGIPAVNYGPGDAMKAHADDERVRLNQITDCEEALRAWLCG